MSDAAAPSARFEEAALGGSGGASTLELFFDLVFVFFVTQLTHAFVHEPSWANAGRITVLFLLTWWMYSGFVWLTNEVAPSTSFRRTVLLAAMFGFFALALAVPEAVRGDTRVFGFAFLGVTVIHAVLFQLLGGPRASAAIRRVGPVNLGTAMLVAGIGFAPPTWRYGLLLGAIAFQAAVPLLTASRGFSIRPAHYCERHGLVLIIAIGESVISVGAGLSGHRLDAPLFALVALGLTLAYVLWWSYFGVDDERGEHRLGQFADDARRSRTALFAYGYAYVPMLMGVVFTAAGLTMTIAQADRHTSWTQALSLSGGVGLYFLGLALFRAVLGIPRPWMRLAAAGAGVATFPLGVAGAVWIQLVTLIGVTYTLVILDDVQVLRGGEHGTYL